MDFFCAEWLIEYVRWADAEGFPADIGAQCAFVAVFDAECGDGGFLEGGVGGKVLSDWRGTACFWSCSDLASAIL